MMIGFTVKMPRIRTAWFAGCMIALHASFAMCATESRSVVLTEDGGQYAEGTRYDPAPGSKQYWADTVDGAIRKSDLDGGSAEDIASGLNLPYGIAFDVALQRLIWTSAGDGIVQTLDPSGKTATTLAASFESPFAIDVSTELEQAYYSAQDNVIYRHSIDLASGEESSYTLLLVVETEPIHGLALDAENGVLYIGDRNGRMSRKFDLRTQEARRLAYIDLEPVVDPKPTVDLGQTIHAAR
jgi:DNA-binding beta-propeller fold protein YncE